MKPIYAHAAGAIALTSLIAACVPAPDSTPAPQPTPVASTPTPEPAPQPPVAAAPAFENWLDAPQTPGDWKYIITALGGAASFGPSEASPLLTLWCDRTRGQVQIIRHGEVSNLQAMTVRTETSERQLRGEIDTNRPARLIATLGANDPLLDAIALTRGRFAVETADMNTLYVPAWAEVTRVIEDCR